MSKKHKTYFWYAFIVWSLGAGFFFSEYFLRVSPGVMFPELMDKYSVGAAAMGALSSFFYYPYILMQIPVGVITDRFGPRRIMVFASLLTGFACVLFAVAQNVELAIIARAIMGFCGAFAFVGTLRIAINWFDLKYFSLLVGLTQATGMMGAAFGSAPLSIYILAVGVEFAMFSFAILFIVIAISMGCMLSRAPVNAPISAQDNQLPSLFLGVKEAVTNKQLWINCLFIGFLYAPTTVLGESWGVNFTESYRGLSQTDAASLVGLIFIGLAVGCPVMGLFASRFGNINCMRFSSAGCAVLVFFLIYVGNLSFAVLFLIYFAYGLLNAGLIPSYAQSALLVRKSISGVALGITNMSSVLIGAISIQLVGVLLDMPSVGKGDVNGVYPQSSYHMIFSVLVLFFILAFVLTFFMKDKSNS
jgi:MFS family permease